MELIFFISIVIVGVITTVISFIPSKKMLKGIKITLFVVIILCLIFQAWYGWNDKKASHVKDLKDAWYQDESLRGQALISDDIRQLKDKEKKGLLSGDDYLLYIARYLESIDQTLKFRDGKNTWEWITAYYNEVSKIPSYFSLADWKEAEKLIYGSMVNEIDDHFAARGRSGGGVRPKVLEIFKTERERTIKAKELEK
ncbi:MAG: hypothetical protein WC676_07725 [Candidatus Omnitrophota bacterium]